MLKKRPDPVTTLETVTPEQAQRWYDDQEKNRPVDSNTVSRYARGMKEGEWDIITGEPFILDWNGKLINAQHRCLAIVESGIPLRTFVTRGVNPDAIHRVDIGKKRTAANTLAMEGVSSYAAVASVIRNVYCVLAEDSRRLVENYTIKETNEEHPSIGDMTRKWRSNPSYWGWLPALGWIYTRAGLGHVEGEMFAFFKSGVMPVGYGDYYPGFTLKAALASKKLETSDKMYFTIRAFHEVKNRIRAPKIYTKPRIHHFGLVPKIAL